MNEDYIEVFPQVLSTLDIRRALPCSQRPHLWRKKDGGNHQTLSVSESYTTRSNAVRGAVPEHLWIHVLNTRGRPIRRFKPRRDSWGVSR